MKTVRPIRRGAPLAAALALAACSGESTVYGDGAGNASSGTGEPAAALPAAPYVEDLVEDAPPPTTTAELVVAPEFEFRTGRDVPLVIDVPEARGATTYLSLCLEWEGDAVAPEVDYDSCVLRTTLEDGYFETDVAIANQHDSVLAVVWFADPAVPPVYRELSVGGA